MLSIVPPTGLVYAGSMFELNCTIQLSNAVNTDVVVTSMWRRNGVLLRNSDTRITSNAIPTNNATMYRAQLMFRPLQLNTDDGLYMCEVTVESNENLGFILSSTSSSNNVSISAIGKSNTVTLGCYLRISSLNFSLLILFSLSLYIHTHDCTYTVPTLAVEMQPPAVTALDVLPYNTFTLRCVASAPTNVFLEKSFVWRNGSSVITDNGNNILITDHDIAMSVSTSELTVNEPSIGRYVYYCTVSVSIPGGIDISTFTTGIATVKGSVCHFVDFAFHTLIYNMYIGRIIPAQPTRVQTVNITSTSVTVQWVIPHLSYTPEQYTINYGTARETLDQRSAVLSSRADISLSNTTYQLTLQGLAPNTNYFFQLRSMNSYGETTTEIMTFMTSEAGMQF